MCCEYLFMMRPCRESDRRRDSRVQNGRNGPLRIELRVFGADLCAEISEKLNASIMLGTGKTPREADIDNTEISDFFDRRKGIDYLQYATSVYTCARLLESNGASSFGWICLCRHPLTFVLWSESLRCARDSWKHGSFQPL